MSDKDLFNSLVSPDYRENYLRVLEASTPPKNQNLADEFQRRLICWVNDFHRDLEEEYEVGGQLASFGRSIEFHFTDIGYWNPSLISFIGVLDDGSPVELVQHVSQINILLVRKKRKVLDEPKRPIGFAAWDEYDAFKDNDS
ncbi:TPA: DUF6173 family protein [Citrobacter freundii]|uniref:DUF6173 family protein n=1 Tax=Citrobacter TaxID=544 RepID=UPI002576D57E|nr:DUF6173 family protein [Citrobacter sp. Cpo221]MDM2753896.1 DUF6173 family protein [Citrobacter sp. Cpo221]